MPTVDIMVEKRNDDYMAYLADNSRVWDCGKSEAEAIGKLVLSAHQSLGLAVLRVKTLRPRKGKK